MLALVVHPLLDNLSQRSTLLALVKDHATASLLRTLDGLLDGLDQIRPAGTDVSSENVRTIALVVRTDLEGKIRSVDSVQLPKPLHSGASDGRQLDLVVGFENGVVAGPLEDAVSEFVLTDSQHPGHLGQIPDGLNGHLGYVHGLVLVHDLLVEGEFPDEFGDLHDCGGSRDGGDSAVHAEGVDGTQVLPMSACLWVFEVGDQLLQFPFIRLAGAVHVGMLGSFRQSILNRVAATLVTTHSFTFV